MEDSASIRLWRRVEASPLTVVVLLLLLAVQCMLSMRLKSVTVDEDWVRERTDDLKLRSYDLSHIQDIETRVDEDDASVRPADRRDGGDRR